VSKIESIALIADVHGNMPALAAVLADAQSRGVDRYLILGDYCLDFPWANEVAETLQNLKNAAIIRGNKEERIASLLAGAEGSLAAEQMAPLRWTMANLTPQNMEYLANLPDDIELEIGGKTIFATHSIRELSYAASRLGVMHSSYANRPDFDRAGLSAQIESAVTTSPQVQTELAELPPRIYAFGHNHMQAHWRVGKSLFVNPGACGVPPDHDPRAPYSILHLENGKTTVQELRVEYDINATIRAAKASDLYKIAKIWCDIQCETIRTGHDYISGFVEHANRLAAAHGELSDTTLHPKGIVGDKMWHTAWDTWETRKNWK